MRNLQWKGEQLLDLSLNKTEKVMLVSDLGLSLDYYATIFGMKIHGATLHDEKNNNIITLKQAEKMTDIKPQRVFPDVYKYVDSINELFALYLKFKENGALFAFNPRDTYDNGKRMKEFAVRDIDGYVLAFKTMTNEQSS